MNPVPSDKEIADILSRLTPDALDKALEYILQLQSEDVK